MILNQKSNSSLKPEETSPVLISSLSKERYLQKQEFYSKSKSQEKQSNIYLINL
jgi:hypothetical protein